MRFIFYRVKKSYSELKWLSNKGATMMVAVVIMGLLIVFTFSLMLVAYSFYASQNKNVSSLRCSEAAITLSQALESELTLDNNNDRFPEKDSYLYKYIRYNICQSENQSYWPYYDPNGNSDHDADHAFRYFDLRYNSSKFNETNGGTGGAAYPKTVDGLPGSTKVCIYWMPKETTNNAPLVMPTTKDQRNGVRLFVEVICESGSQTYSVKTEYELTTGTYSGTYSDRAYYIKNLDPSIKSSVQPIDSIKPVGIDMSVTTAVETDERWEWTMVSRDTE